MDTRKATIGLLLVGGLCVPVPAFAGTPGAALPVSATSAARGGHPRLAGVLMKAESEEADAKGIQTRISALGASVAPELIDVLLEGAYLRPIGRNGHAFTPLTQEQRMGLLGATRDLNWTLVAPGIERRCAENTDLSKRVTLLGLLAQIAPASDLKVLLAPLQGADDRELRSLRGAFGQALTIALQRDPAAYRYAPRLFERAAPSLLATIVGATSGTNAPESLGAITGMLGMLPEADTFLLIEASELSKSAPRPAREATLRPLRLALISTSSTDQVEATKALGRLDDVESLDAFIELMRSTHKSVANEARIALERITAERFGSDPEAWSRWYADTREWRKTALPELKLDLRSADTTEISRALLRIARFRVFRHELSVLVVPLLSHHDESVVNLACAVLGHFGAKTSIEPLIERLESGRPEIKKAALEALERATGLAHGEDVDAWREATR